MRNLPQVYRVVQLVIHLKKRPETLQRQRVGSHHRNRPAKGQSSQSRLTAVLNQKIGTGLAWVCTDSTCVSWIRT
jgi:hypothetical protein